MWQEIQDGNEGQKKVGEGARRKKLKKRDHGFDFKTFGVTRRNVISDNHLDHGLFRMYNMNDNRK